MTQPPPYQPPPQYPQQQPQGAYNPYGPYNHAVPAPVPVPPPFARRPVPSGSPVGAVFLGFFASLLLSLAYSGLILATSEDQSLTMANTLYLGHALLNGALVGCLIGLVGRGSTGAGVFGAVIAALGAFFGYANALPLMIVENDSVMTLKNVLEAEPFFPAELWWTDNDGGVDWFSPLGLVIAAATAWGLAHVVGNRRRQV